MRPHQLLAVPRLCRSIIPGGLLAVGISLLAVTAAAHDLVDFGDVQPILTRSCGGAGCHINEQTSGVDLSSYESLVASVGDQYGGPVVIPGNPDDSPLIDKIQSDLPRFGLRMPRVGDPLDAADIATLRAWIRDGARRPHGPARGDTDGNGSVEITDAIRILIFLFRDGVAFDCPPQADADADGLIQLTDAVFLLNYLFRGGGPPGDLSDEEEESCEEATELSFTSIYEKVFAVSCAFSACHDAELPRAGLSLASREEAFNSLVGVAPFNQVARTSGLLRVAPGRPENSFLLRKLTGPGPGEGNRMPANSPVPLSDATVSAIREWISAGAPLEGTIDGVADITDEPPPPIDRMSPPPPPENGVQLHLEPFAIGPGRERQIHYFGGAPFSELEQDEIWVQRIDIHMLEQSHHFILFHWVAANDPRPGHRDGTFVDINRVRLVAVSQQSFFTLSFPEGVGLRFDKNTRFDLNSHYVNLNGEQTLMGEVYVNIFFAEPGSITTVVKPIFDFGGSINVRPGGVSTSTGLFPSATTQALDPALAAGTGRVRRETHIYALAGHMHRHGTHFDAHRTDTGEKVYETWSWDDPDFTIYDPPLVLPPGAGLRYSASYDYYDPPSPNAPPLTWGSTSEDEMIILLGYYAVP